jgi:hypothetical protein
MPKAPAPARTKIIARASLAHVENIATTEIILVFRVEMTMPRNIVDNAEVPMSKTDKIIKSKLKGL